MNWKWLRGDAPLKFGPLRRGYHYGGPLRIGAILTLALTLAGCMGSGGNQRRAPSPRHDHAVMRPLSIYEQLGLLTGSDEFPVVASFTSLAGPSDSTYIILGLSLPNSALMFQRDGDAGFVARYAVSLTLSQGDEVAHRKTATHIVRVPNFNETGRTDESVVYQMVVAVEPGSYAVELEAWDVAVARKRVRLQDTLVVPTYRDGGRQVAGPYFVYQAEGRDARSEVPELIVNPRHTIPYGSESMKIYLETYDLPKSEPLRVRVLGDDDEELWGQEYPLADSAGEISYLTLDLPGAELPLGRLWLEMSIGSDSAAVVERVPLVVSVSDEWMVNNFDDMLEFLSYIAHDSELDSLRNAPPSERAARWDEFWARREPAGATRVPGSSFRDRFFERLRLASIYFAEPGRPGWKTERGEVFIVLGAPSYIYESYDQQTSLRPVYYDWVYEDGPTGRLVLTFMDRYNMERYELTPASKAAFRSAANWLKSQSVRR